MIALFLLVLATLPWAPEWSAHLAILPLIIGGIAALGSAGIGAASSAADREKAIKENEAAVREWLAVNIPDPATQKLAMQRFVQTGELTPELEEAVKRDKSAYEGVQRDPRLKDTSMRALRELEDMGFSGGLTFEDKANLAEAEADIAADARSRRDTITDSMARKGMGGTGLDLQAQLAGAQSDTNRVAQSQLRTLADSRKRGFDAIIGAGDLAGRMDDRDYKQQSDLASARDAIADFNARNMQDVRTRNVNRRNDATATNLGERQRISDANTGLTNEEMKWNTVGRHQQAFDNQAKVAGGKAAARQGAAAAYNQAADRTANNWANIGTGLAKVGTGIYQEDREDERRKTLRGY